MPEAAFCICHLTFTIYKVQQEDTTNKTEFTDVSQAPASGRILALDLGTKRIGVAVSDELQMTTRAVCVVERKSWKKVLKQVAAFLAEFDAAALVIGLPLNTDGSESQMSSEARRLARNFSLSLPVPVFLQDERVTTYEARGRLWKQGVGDKQMRKILDGEAAAIILEDFIEQKNL
jgi:putative Holliday junction resolvase